MTVLLVALGGALGAAARFVVDGWIRSRRPTAFPVATVTVNVTGSLLIGALAGLHLAGALGSPWYVAAATGVCGGYTTFSTAMVETVRLVQSGRVREAVLNVVVSVVASVAAVALGATVALALAG